MRLNIAVVAASAHSSVPVILSVLSPAISSTFEFKSFVLRYDDWHYSTQLPVVFQLRIN